MTTDGRSEGQQPFMSIDSQWEFAVWLREIGTAVYQPRGCEEIDAGGRFKREGFIPSLYTMADYVEADRNSKILQSNYLSIKIN